MTSIIDVRCAKHKIVKLIGEYDLCIRCGVCTARKEEKKIPLRPIHYLILRELREMFPQYFRKNRTSYFYAELWRYIYELKVFRITLMGETRGGKSEEGQTIALNYAIIFNALYDEGHFKNVNVEYMKGLHIIVEKIHLDAEHVHANQSAYLYHLRDKTREKKLVFGQIHIVDEDRDNPGGIGSFSEEMEISNLNNIVAKFMQAEIWIRPRRFQQMNAPYGINCLIKDITNRTNWSLLYKLEMNSLGIHEENFIGWIGIEMHADKKLRNEYQIKKDLWIEQELKGTINERAHRRMAAIEHMLKSETFTQHKIGKDGQIKWHHGVDSMKFLVEKAMGEQKIDQFNDTEIERIVHGARALGEERLREKPIAEEEQ